MVVLLVNALKGRRNPQRGASLQPLRSGLSHDVIEPRILLLALQVDSRSQDESIKQTSSKQVKPTKP